MNPAPAARRIRRLLIANRGEIACRVIHSARAVGITCIAVFSEADRGSAHVSMADEAVYIGPAEARLSYLNQAAILEAAHSTGADALHPGYGFLSENAEFAQAVTDAGLRFIGPSAAAILAMGSKAHAKALMAQAGVPLVPGYYGERQDAEWLEQQASLIGYPILIKASAGGGGKGMRRVDKAEDFAAALSACQREGLASFGDARVLIERYIIEPRHIEVQIFGDAHGRIVSLLERDCSLQRRHQKVIEEAPAPGWSMQKRQAMNEAAIAAARSVQYEGAGTVEFIVDQAGDFFFMEMNTRLQVEHPVTEMILGEDLVAWQLKVAMGEPLPAHWDQLQSQGHAIEARLYAENPRRGFLPSTGRLVALNFPEACGRFDCSQPIRVDAGVRSGDLISADYDPMIAKIIVKGEDREQALANMRQALAATSVLGPSNNRAFLQKLMADPDVKAGKLSTALIESKLDSLAGPLSATEKRESLLAIASAWALQQRSPQTWDAFSLVDGWRHRGLRASDAARFQIRLRELDEPHRHEHCVDICWMPDIVIKLDGEHWQLQSGHWHGKRLSANLIHLESSQAKHLHASLAGIESLAQPATPDHLIQVDLAHASSSWQYLVEDGQDDSADLAQGSLQAPMPGKIIALHIAAGDTVKAGQVLMVLEAMKMEHAVLAPCSGKATKLVVALGDQVADGAVLAQIDKLESRP